MYNKNMMIRDERGRLVCLRDDYRYKLDDKKQLENLYYEKKLNQYEIANLLLVSQRTVSDAFKRFGLKVRKNYHYHAKFDKDLYNKKFTKSDIKRVKKLFPDGYTRREIANMTGINFWSVDCIIRSRISKEEREKVRMQKLKKGGQIGKKIIEKYNKENPFRPNMRGDKNPAKRLSSRRKIKAHWDSHKEERLRAMLSVQSPSGYERKIMKINDIYNLGLKFVGNGGLVIGGKCPDFVKDKKLIEVYYDWYKIRSHGSVEAYEDSFSLIYNSNGYEVLFLDKNDMTKGYPEQCLQKIQTFLTPLGEQQQRGM